jgi:hypothetical protein
MALTLADSFLNDLDELEEDNDEEEQEETNEELANDLEESDDDVMAELKDEGVDAKIKLQSSERYRRHMAAIAERSEKPASFDDDEEYSLIVESNEILVKMDAELHEVHAYVNDLYGKKIPGTRDAGALETRVSESRGPDEERDGHDASGPVGYLTTDSSHGRVGHWVYYFGSTVN